MDAHGLGTLRYQYDVPLPLDESESEELPELEAACGVAGATSPLVDAASTTWAMLPACKTCGS